MKNIAILGFGVVGQGVADLLTKNAGEVARLVGDEIYIKYILDLRDFPDSPFADRVVHDFKAIAADDSVDAVIEVMGGSHPAFEFTMEALGHGKHVITSNKQVVAEFGAEMLAEARKNGVCYHFEASVGGGIPVLMPIIEILRHNKVREVRGILNGTTNYILTKMFTFGDTFEDSLKDAQEKGYAERNPDADILGIDACRKTAILGALISGASINPDLIHTEGITAIRAEDVAAANKNHFAIKLLGRAICEEGGKVMLMVAPFLIDADAPLGGVHGVYNAVEVIGDPIDNVMFYGRGAGAGPTASAVVGDLCRCFTEGTHTAPFAFEKQDERLSDFSAFAAAHYIATDASLDAVKAAFGEVTILAEGAELAILTKPMTEADYALCAEKLPMGAKIFSHLRKLA